MPTRPRAREDWHREVETELARERARDRIRESRREADWIADIENEVLSDRSAAVSRQRESDEYRGFRRQVSVMSTIESV